MKRKEKQYQMPDVRPLDQRSTGKRIKPGQNPDAVEQLVFNENLQLVEMEFPDIRPAYAKKYFHKKT